MTPRALVRCLGPQLALCLALCLCSTRALAQASAATPVHLSVEGCDVVSAETLAGLVALELSPRPVWVMDQTNSDYGRGGGTVARVRCERARAALVVWDSPGSDALRLELDLERTPDVARARLLALTLSELIVSSRMGRAPPQEGSRPLTERTDDARPQISESSVQLFLGPGAVLAGRPSLASLLVEAGALAPVGPLRVMALLQWDRGVRVQGADEASAWTLSAALVAAATARLGMFEPLLGLGLRSGFARLSGSSSRPEVDGQALSGLWLAPLAAAALHAAMTDAVGARIGLELGYVLSPLRGTDEAGQHLLYAFEGLRLSASLALLVSL